jgi:hypothetical protein
MHLHVLSVSIHAPERAVHAHVMCPDSCQHREGSGAQQVLISHFLWSHDASTRLHGASTALLHTLAFAPLTILPRHARHARWFSVVLPAHLSLLHACACTPISSPLWLFQRWFCPGRVSSLYGSFARTCLLCSSSP